MVSDTKKYSLLLATITWLLAHFRWHSPTAHFGDGAAQEVDAKRFAGRFEEAVGLPWPSLLTAMGCRATRCLLCRVWRALSFKRSSAQTLKRSNAQTLKRSNTKLCLANALSCAQVDTSQFGSKKRSGKAQDGAVRRAVVFPLLHGACWCLPHFTAPLPSVQTFLLYLTVFYSCYLPRKHTYHIWYQSTIGENKSFLERAAAETENDTEEHETLLQQAWQCFMFLCIAFVAQYWVTEYAKLERRRRDYVVHGCSTFKNCLCACFSTCMHLCVRFCGLFVVAVVAVVVMVVVTLTVCVCGAGQCQLFGRFQSSCKACCYCCYCY